MEIAHPLRRYRLEAGLSLAQMAERIGVQRNTVWRWEAGKQSPPPKLWGRIRQATDGRVSVADFERVEAAE